MSYSLADHSKKLPKSRVYPSPLAASKGYHKLDLIIYKNLTTMTNALVQNEATAQAVADQQPIRKMCFILSKATLDSVYACMVMANGARMEGIDAEIFFTFFGLEAINKKRMNNLHVATVGNPAMHIPTILGGMPGMETFVTSMMKKEMEALDMPEISEFIEIISASGAKLWACKLAMDMFHLKEEDLVDELDGVLTVGEFYERAKGLSTQVIFI